MKRFLMFSLLFVMALGYSGLLTPTGASAQVVQTPLNPKLIPKFVDPLPGLDALGVIVAGPAQIELRMTEFQTSILPTGFVPPGPAPFTGTWVWGYLQPGQTSKTSYLGPVILATRHQPTEIKWVNNLGNAATTNVLAYRNSTDQTLNWADPANLEANPCSDYGMNNAGPPDPSLPYCSQNYTGFIPAGVHLHGGEIPPGLDGGPDAWFTSDGSRIGHGYYSRDNLAPKNYAIYRYPNSQTGAPVWFHDHVLGGTRLNVYAGLAGAYLITDPANDPANLPPLIPLVIQDRMFDTNGQLYFPAGIPFISNPEHPFWVPEFVGDTIVVNGKTWPFLNVEPKRYTFLFLNGSNARAYEMFLVDPVSGNRGPTLWVIGTDGGYLDKPVPVGPPGRNSRLVIMPGERYQAIIDFAGYQAGVIGPNGLPYSGNWLLRNTAKTPFPNGAAAVANTTGQIMQFRVAGAPVNDTTFNPAVLGATLRNGPVGGANPIIARLINPVTGTVAAGVTVDKKRQLTLNEVIGMPTVVNGIAYPGGPLEILVNNTKWSGFYSTGTVSPGIRDGFQFIHDIHGGQGYSEILTEGTTEQWEVINLTADAHPIHFHLAQFQVMNRQDFDVKKYAATYNASFPGGSYDPVTKLPYLAKTYMPGYGPPLSYTNPNTDGALGGNPAITPFLKGAAVPPSPNEAGWKDTIIMYPGQVTRLVVRWAPTDLPVTTPATGASFPFSPGGEHGYVWHCHIIDHEDNEMMRPTIVVPNAPDATRTYQQVRDY